MGYRTVVHCPRLKLVTGQKSSFWFLAIGGVNFQLAIGDGMAVFGIQICGGTVYKRQLYGMTVDGRLSVGHGSVGSPQREG